MEGGGPRPFGRQGSARLIRSVKAEWTAGRTGGLGVGVNGIEWNGVCFRGNNAHVEFEAPFGPKPLQGWKIKWTER